jgi:hypothetical protein
LTEPAKFGFLVITDIKTELFGVVKALNASGIPYALCGGLAVVLHGYPRATQDIDLLILPDDYAKVKSAVAPLGFRFEATPMTFKAGQPEEQKIMRISKIVDEDALMLDFVLADGFLRKVWENRQAYVIEGMEIVAVDRDGLITMKKASGRTKDLADLEQLPSDD